MFEDWNLECTYHFITGGPGPEIEMTGGGFLSRPRRYMGCSAWEWM